MTRAELKFLSELEEPMHFPELSHSPEDEVDLEAEAAELELLLSRGVTSAPRSMGDGSTRSPHRNVLSKRRTGPSSDASNVPVRAPLPSDVHGWILSTDRSAVELIADPGLRNKFLREVNWSQEYFRGNRDAAGHRAEGRLAEELFNAMARVIPERRVPFSIRFRPDIANIVVPIPGEHKIRGQRDKMLHPEASAAFVRMREAASKDGIPVHPLPGALTTWRTAAEQRGIHGRQPNPLAAAADKSAHMYGLAVDLRLGVRDLPISEASTKAQDNMANVVRMYRSPVYKWMALYGGRLGWFPYRREPWHWEYNPAGFKARYEAGSEKSREIEFESEFELTDEFEEAVDELTIPFSRRPLRYPEPSPHTLDAGLDNGVAQREFEHWAEARQGPARGRPTRAMAPKAAGHWLAPFTSTAIPKYKDLAGKLQPTACSVYLPNAAWKQTVVDLLVFFHGDPGPCSDRFIPDVTNTSKKFGLDVQIDGSGRSVVLAVPVVHWIPRTQQNIQGKWTAANLNKFVEEVCNEIGRQSGVKPALGQLIIAGHSHAFAILSPLAVEFDRGASATKRGAMAKLNEVWALDSTYGEANARALDSWARTRPKSRFVAVLNRQPGTTYKKPIDGWTAYLKARGAGPPPNLKMCRVKENHCTIPAKYVGLLLSSNKSSQGWCVP